MDESDGAHGELFERLYASLGRKLRLLAAHRGIPATDCEDIVQDVFHRALRGYGDDALVDPAKVAAWVFGIFNHVVAGYWRTKARHDRLIPVADSCDVETQLVTHDPDTSRQVQEVLRSLSKRHRLALLLNVRVGLTTEQIAPILKCSSGRAGAILAEAKRRFRTKYLGGEEKSVLRRLKE